MSLAIVGGIVWLLAIVALCGMVHRLKQWLDNNPPTRERRKHIERVPLMTPDDLA